MNKKVIIGVLLLIAVLTRGYQLGAVPHGMTWDEAAIGYNGHAVVTTRHDEWLERLPISFQSFGDYKAPAAIYLNGLFTFIFGMNLFAVRLPFFLAGIVAILGFGYLGQLLDRESNLQTPLLLGFLMVFSPWHTHFSRVGFESGLALSMVISAVCLFLLWTQTKVNNKIYWATLLGSILFAVGSLYTYHSAKIVAPLLFIFLAWHFRKKFSATTFVTSSVVAIGLTYPLLLDSFMGQGLQRASSTVFATHDFFDAVLLTGTQFLHYLHPEFILGGTVDSLRHGDGVWGVLLPTSGLLFYIGIFRAAFRVVRMWFTPTADKHAHEFLDMLGLVWTSVGLLPAAIGDVPFHSNRALLALPGMLLLVFSGLRYLLEQGEKLSIAKKIRGSHGEKYILRKAILGSFIMLHFMFYTQYLSHYFLSYASNTADAYSDGYIEAFEIAEQYEKGLDNAPEVQKIIFTSQYGQPYIYALFVRETNPIWYRGGSLSKYEFTENITAGDLSRESALIVSTPQNELPPDEADHIVYGSDGQPRFLIYVTEGSQ